MVNFFLRFKSKKDLYIISKASIISLFTLLFFSYDLISKYVESSHLWILTFSLFLITLALSYVKIPMQILTEFEKFYPEVPFIIIGMGSLTLLILFFSIDVFFIPILFNPLLGYIFKYSLLLSLFFIIPSGIILLIASLAAKISLEKRVFFTLKKASALLDNIEDNNNIDTKNLKGYIYLTYRNIKTKIGKELKLEPKPKNNNSILDLDHTFLNYLPYYIEFADKEQLQFLKKNLETMEKSVNEKDELKWISLTPMLLKLNDEILTYLTDIHFNLTYKKLTRRSEFIFKNKDFIVQTIGVIVPIILFILTILFAPKVP